ncbi:hypothetical protein BV25DRAFT_1829009 [Artomyces pyxidatus]|uniref:Uncharacterized protein n=1 Tax=Artomyces pyxidatus TaxID=48021 RepID=A0ACB8STF1_9AGAM|nr:hypothetical protein BV25DRAFT_1829009 [Artomyces pyxidatus]
MSQATRVRMPTASVTFGGTSIHDVGLYPHEYKVSRLRSTIPQTLSVQFAFLLLFVPLFFLFLSLIPSFHFPWILIVNYDFTMHFRMTAALVMVLTTISVTALPTPGPLALASRDDVVALATRNTDSTLASYAKRFPGGSDSSGSAGSDSSSGNHAPPNNSGDSTHVSSGGSTKKGRRGGSNSSSNSGGSNSSSSGGSDSSSGNHASGGSNSSSSGGSDSSSGNHAPPNNSGGSTHVGSGGSTHKGRRDASVFFEEY